MKVIVKFAAKLDVSKWSNPDLAKVMISEIIKLIPGAKVTPDTKLSELFQSEFKGKSSEGLYSLYSAISKIVNKEVTLPHHKTFKKWYDENKSIKMPKVTSNLFKISNANFNKLNEKELLDLLEIPDYKSKFIQGKRSKVFDTQTNYLSQNAPFINALKEALNDNWGSIISVKNKSVNYSYPEPEQHRIDVSSEREWNQSIGTAVVVTIKTSGHTWDINSEDY